MVKKSHYLWSSEKQLHFKESPPHTFQELKASTLARDYPVHLSKTPSLLFFKTFFCRNERSPNHNGQKKIISFIGWCILSCTPTSSQSFISSFFFFWCFLFHLVKMRADFPTLFMIIDKLIYLIELRNWSFSIFTRKTLERTHHFASSEITT